MSVTNTTHISVSSDVMLKDGSMVHGAIACHTMVSLWQLSPRELYSLAEVVRDESYRIDHDVAVRLRRMDIIDSFDHDGTVNFTDPVRRVVRSAVVHEGHRVTVKTPIM